MFAKSKSSGSTPSVLLPNPLQNLYDVGKQTATAGPENAWRIYNGYTKADRKVILDRPIIPFRNVCFKSETLEIYSPRLFSSRNNRTSNYNSLEKVLLSKSIRNYLLFYYYNYQLLLFYTHIYRKSIQFKNLDLEETNRRSNDFDRRKKFVNSPIIQLAQSGNFKMANELEVDCNLLGAIDV